MNGRYTSMHFTPSHYNEKKSWLPWPTLSSPFSWCVCVCAFFFFHHCSIKALRSLLRGARKGLTVDKFCPLILFIFFFPVEELFRFFWWLLRVFVCCFLCVPLIDVWLCLFVCLFFIAFVHFCTSKLNVCSFSPLLTYSSFSFFLSFFFFLLLVFFEFCAWLIFVASTLARCHFAVCFCLNLEQNGKKKNKGNAIDQEHQDNEENSCVIVSLFFFSPPFPFFRERAGADVDSHPPLFFFLLLLFLPFLYSSTFQYVKVVLTQLYMYLFFSLKKKKNKKTYFSSGFWGAFESFRILRYAVP